MNIDATTAENLEPVLKSKADLLREKEMSLTFPLTDEQKRLFEQAQQKGALNCAVRGYVIIPHNEARNFEANLLRRVCL